MRRLCTALTLVLTCGLPPAARAQDAAAAPDAAPADAQASSQPFKPEQIEQLVAPIALYPDSLLAQVFMAWMREQNAGETAPASAPTS